LPAAALQLHSGRDRSRMGARRRRGGPAVRRLRGGPGVAVRPGPAAPRRAGSTQRVGDHGGVRRVGGPGWLLARRGRLRGTRTAGRPAPVNEREEPRMAKQDSGDKATSGTPAARARARAAEVRAEQERAAKERRLVNQLLAVVLVIVAAGAITAAVIAGQRSANAPAETPPNLSAEGAVVQGNPDAETVLQVVEDFQCPACGQFEAVFGETLD